MKRVTQGIARERSTGGAVESGPQQGRLDFVQTSLTGWRQDSRPLQGGVNSNPRAEPRSTKKEETETTVHDPWTEALDRFVRFKESEQIIGPRWVQGIRWSLSRTPRVWKRLGVSTIPRTPIEVKPEHLSIIRTSSRGGRAALDLHFCALRRFLRWAGNDLSANRTAWRLPPVKTSRRRWLTKDQLSDLCRAAPSPRARLVIALEGFNGLRRVEVLRLRVKDVNLGQGLLDIHGNGKMGGKWRQIPLHSLTMMELKLAIAGKRPEDRILPVARTMADNVLRTAADSAGFAERGTRVSHHDLRRTFGRLANEAGMDLVQLKNLYGHNSLDQTIHYIGLDVRKMREGIELLEESMRVTSDHPEASSSSQATSTGRN